MSEFYIAENIKRLRTYYGYKQQEIADELHISRQAYSNYERGVRLPDIEKVVCMAQFYRIPLDCLLLSPDPARMIKGEKIYGEYAAATPVGSLVPMSKEELRLFLRYKRLRQREKEEVKEFVAFKEACSERRGGKN